MSAPLCPDALYLTSDSISQDELLLCGARYAVVRCYGKITEEKSVFNKF